MQTRKSWMVLVVFSLVAAPSIASAEDIIAERFKTNAIKMLAQPVQAITGKAAQECVNKVTDQLFSAQFQHVDEKAREEAGNYLISICMATVAKRLEGLSLHFRNKALNN